MFAKVLSVSASLILSVAGVASAADTMPTKFVVRVENITKPDAFTASNGVKWSLGFSPGVAVVHTEKSAVFTVGKKDRGEGLEAQSEEGDPGMLAKSMEGGKGVKSVLSSTRLWARALQVQSLQAQRTSLPYPACREIDCP